MKSEAKIKLTTLESIISGLKKNLRQVLWENIDKILSEFPEDKEEINQEYAAMCQRCGIDFFSEMQHNWEKELVEYVDHNVPDVK